MEINMQTSNNNKLTTINLFCPSLSTTAPFMASHDECIDIGSIAAVFGLEPSSVKLNGYFISRGIDLVSSLTWESLLSFFSKKRLPVGGSRGDDAIVVDGKLSIIGLNRSKRMECSLNNNKRKQHMEAVILLKKLKLNETKSGFDKLYNAGKETISNAANVAPRSPYSCSCNRKNMKRMREDETLVSTFCKKTR